MLLDGIVVVGIVEYCFDIGLNVVGGDEMFVEGKGNVEVVWYDKVEFGMFVSECCNFG